MGERPAAALILDGRGGRLRAARAGAGLLVCLALAGCSGAPPEDPAKDVASSAAPGGSPSSATPSRDAEPSGPSGPSGPSRSPEPEPPVWDVGARPLPLRPDGLGVMRPTPKVLRDRRLPTPDTLPPPADGRFRATVGPVTADVRRRMGRTWSPRCPVALDGLRHLTVTFRGFDGNAHTGELVIAAAEARDVVSVFRALFAADFPIEEMRLPTTADLEAHPTGDGNNTAGLVCRPTTGGTSWSAHAYGLAIDLNPFHNPYEKGDVVLPELASAYLDRSWERPGMVLDGSLVVREFARIGWEWGGAWSSLKDYQHFSATGR